MKFQFSSSRADLCGSSLALPARLSLLQAGRVRAVFGLRSLEFPWGLKPVPRPISLVTSCRARVGRVTPCAPRSADSFPNGAHGVTRPTTSRNLFVTVLGALAVWSVSLYAATPIRFRDATEASGIRFVHTDGSSGKRYIVETVASGLGLMDFDGDGYLDILFLNGEPLPGTPKPARLPTNALYHNNRDGTFTDVTAGSGLDAPGYALGCAVADYDNDGYEDILITYYGRL